jgi:hypothetical protein
MTAAKSACSAAAIASIIGADACHAQEGVEAKATAFDGQIFAGMFGRKSYACFVRRYDANHLVAAENTGDEIRLGCGVDCRDGGIQVAMKDDKSALIRLEPIGIRERNKADDASNDLVADAKIFHVGRAYLHERSELVTDRKELAALRHK